MHTLAIYPGTFDPPTLGHLDLVARACEVFSKVIVAVSQRAPKQTMFSVPERMDMMRRITEPFARVEVDAFDGLLVDFMRRRGAHVVLRGLRAIGDFEYEFQMAQMNRKLYPGFEIVYMMPDEKFTYISSSLAKEVALLGGDISSLVPDVLHSRLRDKCGAREGG